MDFVTFHFYGINIDQLKAEVEQYKGYGKPIWVTRYVIS
jgi:O-glycosyl hydrolase